MQTVNTALLSYGMSGRIFHAPFIEQHPGFELAGSWERSTKRIHEHYPQVRSYATLDELLADDAIDLVVVNTPTYTHYELTKKVLQSGKHVVVEKAFAGNADEARELRDLAKAAGRTLSVFQNRRWDSHFLCVRKVLEDGVLGDIVEANLGYCRFDPALSPKVHKEEPSSGAGIVKDLGPHAIDQALVLFGKRGCFLKDRADVQEPQLDEGIKPSDAGYGVEPDGCEGRLYVGDGDEPQLVASPPGNYMAFYEGVHASITDGKPEPVSAEDGVRVMRVIDAAFRSHREGKVIAP